MRSLARAFRLWRARHRCGDDRQLERRAGRPPATCLGVSGGGDDGAFGAGLLCGWADSGKMPKFKLVTGVTTGAMIAPFPFLGGAYTDRLRTMYTSIKPDDISEDRGLYGALFGEALADT